MIKTTINICGKEVPFCSSAAVPRLYRVKFRRDLFRDLKKLQDSYDAKTDSYAIEDLEVFENVAYIMAYHADSSIPSSIEEWLDGFEMFSIYEILPQLLDLWGANMETQVPSKKNGKRPSVK